MAAAVAAGRGERELACVDSVVDGEDDVGDQRCKKSDGHDTESHCWIARLVRRSLSGQRQVASMARQIAS